MEEKEDEVDNSRKEEKEITVIARDIFQLYFIVVSLIFFFLKKNIFIMNVFVR